jgi:hypothetical protein
MKETAPAFTRLRFQADALKALANQDWTAATEHLAMALIENPAWADGWLNLGLARLHLHQPQAAISALQRGIDLDPNRPRARCTLAETWLQAGDLEAAAEAGRDECRRFPDIADNWLCLGRTLEQMEHPEAGSAYDQAHHLSPEKPDTAWHWARWLMRSTRRIASSRPPAPGIPTQRNWNGNSPLTASTAKIGSVASTMWIAVGGCLTSPKGPSPEGVPLWQPGTEPRSPILLEPEQGLRDSIQFIRFIPELARRGHRVWLGCPKPLRTLLEGFPGVERLLANTAEAAGAGCRLPLMSLPSRLGITDLSKFSAPYLKAPRPQTDSPTEAAQQAPGRRRIGFV